MDAIETEGDELMDSSQLNDDEEEVKLPGLPPNTKNYMTPACYRRLLDEREKLVNVERPAMVNVVSWAASNGDRSENGDYLYGKRRLREMDRRIRFLNKRIESAEVVDPATRPQTDQIFFGATVVYESLSDHTEHTIRIVGIDEADPEHGDVSWVSPIARVFLKAREGDQVKLPTPATIDHPAHVEILEIIEVRYVSEKPG
jgi:transcription elongation factor greB